jgi:AraC family transcriptional regulator
MDYIRQIETILVFIENNLGNELNLDTLAEAGCFSRFHFLRVFSSITGETPGSYIRRRRLTAAASQLVESSRKIIQIAMDTGFDSPESFCRSFVSVR